MMNPYEHRDEFELEPKNDTLKALTRRVAEARHKHPDWGGSLGNYALSVLRLEVEELAHAMHWECRERERQEALDVAAVALRIYEGDLNKPKRRARGE